MFSDVRRIAGLAWPVLIGQLAIIAFGVIDTAMVGRYSAVDLAALGHNSPEYLHLLLETIKLASADRTHHAGADRATIEALLDPAYAAERRALIDRRRAAPSEGERYVPEKTDQVRPGDPRRHPWPRTTSRTSSSSAPSGKGAPSDPRRARDSSNTLAVSRREPGPVSRAG